MTTLPQTFFVTWRSPTTRAIRPVARIRYYADQSYYEFRYIANVATALADGFTPLLEFPELERTYTSPRPFPLLANRFMPPKRPEYAGFLAALGLPPDAHPMAILARTGGERQTDQIELFPVPTPAEDGCYLTHCLVRGVRHMPEPETEKRVGQLQPGDSLNVVPEPENPRDPLAARLETDDGVALGYLPAYLAADVWRLREVCGQVGVHVERVNPLPAEAHHRLLVRVKACWPPGFVPYSGQEFQPVPPRQLT